MDGDSFMKAGDVGIAVVGAVCGAVLGLLLGYWFICAVMLPNKVHDAPGASKSVIEARP